MYLWKYHVYLLYYYFKKKRFHIYRYDALNNPNETTRYLELAFEEYQSEKDNYKMEAEVARKMADIYIDLQEWLSGSRANGLAARAYAILRDWENQAITTCHEATCLYHGRRQDLALQIADDCMIVCQKVPQGASLGMFTFYDIMNTW